MCAANAAAARVSVSETSHFARFGLAEDFCIDLDLLGKRYREQASAIHPDRFVAADERQQHGALMATASLNEAYQVLKNPARRALYLLALNGQTLPTEATVQDSGFLLLQMQCREELENLEQQADDTALQAFKLRLQDLQETTGQAFAACWKDAGQREMAEKLARRLQFLGRLSDEVRLLEERFDD